MNIPKYIETYRNDLSLKNYATNSIENYVSQIKKFLFDHNDLATEPAKINETMIKQWLLKANSINGRKHRLSALKLFYKHTVKQPMKLKYIEYPRSERKLPQVLSVSEVQAMFDVCENLKHKAIMAVLYSCGLRVSELINLKWEHIDRKNGIINIIQAKGNTDRNVPLNDVLIQILTDYWRQYKTKTYIFSGQFGEQYSDRSVNEVLKQLAAKAGIKKRIYAHLMRHNCFTHLLEASTDISVIQKIAGHKSPKTTQLYTHISPNHLKKVATPLTFIKLSP